MKKEIKKIVYRICDLEGCSVKFQLTSHNRLFCFDPQHKIFMADMTWIPAFKASVGDEVVAFDEFVLPGEKHRKYRKAVIEDIVIESEPLYKVVIENSDELFVTADHKWLTRRAWPGKSGTLIWRTTSQLKDEINYGEKATRLSKFWTPFEEINTFDAGWLSGIFDGEGYFSWMKNSVGSGGRFELGVSQNPGLVLNRLVNILDFYGFKYRIDDVSKNYSNKRVVINGGLPEYVRLLGSIKPIRLFSKLDIEKFGRIRDTYKNPMKIHKIEYVGMGEVIKISTSTNTLIVDGYLMHNCSRDHTRISTNKRLLEKYHSGKKPLPKGRICGGQGCGTVLNTYNKSTFCYRCRRDKGLP